MEELNNLEELEELKKKVVLLTMKNERLEEDIKKYQMVIKEILTEGIYKEESEMEDGEESTTTEHSENPA